eukprot:g1386.t1
MGEHSKEKDTREVVAGNVESESVVMAASPDIDSGSWQCPVPLTEEELRKAIEALKGNKILPRVEKPKMPKVYAKWSNKRKILAYQKYILQFQYNHTGTRYFTVSKKSMTRVTATAKQIMSKALPIQCLEATILGCFLTSWMKDVERVPVSFKSRVGNSTFRHIVLAIKCNVTNKWGALGLSRKETLAYKSLVFDTLADLVKNYKDAYEACWHKLVKVYIGFPFSHDPFCPLPMNWRVLRLRVCSHPWEKISEALRKYDNEMKQIAMRFLRFGKLPVDFLKTFCLSESTRCGGGGIGNAGGKEEDDDEDSSDFEVPSPRRSSRDRMNCFKATKNTTAQRLRGCVSPSRPLTSRIRGFSRNASPCVSGRSEKGNSSLTLPPLHSPGIGSRSRPATTRQRRPKTALAKVVDSHVMSEKSGVSPTAAPIAGVEEVETFSVANMAKKDKLVNQKASSSRGRKHAPHALVSTRRDRAIENKGSVDETENKGRVDADDPSTEASLSLSVTTEVMSDVSEEMPPTPAVMSSRMIASSFLGV